MTLNNKDQYKLLLRSPSEIAELTAIVEGFKHSKVKATFSNEAPEGLRGKPIDQNTISSLIKQYQSMLEDREKVYESLGRKIANSESKKIKVKNNKDAVVSQFSYPFYVSDLFKDFVKDNNFGLANLPVYEERGISSASCVDGRDINAVKSLFVSSFPDQELTDEVLKSHNLQAHLTVLLDSNVINGVAINDLFSIFALANSLVDPKNASRIKINSAFEKYILDKKVDWTFNGENVMRHVDVNSYRDELSRLYKEGIAADEEAALRRKDCEIWTKCSHSPPKNKKAKSYLIWKDNTYESLFELFTLAQNKSDLLSKSAKGVLSKMFKEDISSPPYPLIKKILNQGKTFREVLNEKSNAIVNEEDAKDGIWGISSTMISTIISYIRIPSVVVKTQLAPKLARVPKGRESTKQYSRHKDWYA